MLLFIKKYKFIRGFLVLIQNHVLLSFILFCFLKPFKILNYPGLTGPDGQNVLQHVERSIKSVLGYATHHLMKNGDAKDPGLKWSCVYCKHVHVSDTCSFLHFCLQLFCRVENIPIGHFVCFIWVKFKSREESFTLSLLLLKNSTIQS